MGLALAMAVAEQHHRLRLWSTMITTYNIALLLVVALVGRLGTITTPTVEMVELLHM